MSIHYTNPLHSTFSDHYFETNKNFPQNESAVFRSKNSSCRSSISSDTESLPATNHNAFENSFHSLHLYVKDSSLPPLEYNHITNSTHIHPGTSFKKQLSLGDFDVEQKIGMGSSGSIYLVKSKLNNNCYAMKVICKKNRREIQIQDKLDHPFIVKLWDSFESETHLFLIMEYAPCGDLFSIIRERKLTEDKARFYATEVLLALEHLHQLNIVYRDLKPENILLDHRGHVKLTDFGLAKIVTDATWTLCGTPDYLAPEIISNNNKGYNQAVDLWSFGVLIYEMLTGQPPFYAKNPIEQYQKILECDITWPDFFSIEVKDLLQNLLQTKPSDRFSINNIKKHPWFQSIHFKDFLVDKVTPPRVSNNRCFEPPYLLTDYCGNFSNF